MSWSQSDFVLIKHKKSSRINFKLINNLIIFPIEINGVELSFILDTGISKPILFNFLNISEDLQINNTKTIYLRGLGEGSSVKAYSSEDNFVKIGDAVSAKQKLFAVIDSNLNFSPRLGVPVHGIIGFDVFKNFIVEINYSNRYFKLYDRSAYRYKKCGSCERFDIEYHRNKPYINGQVYSANKQVTVKLLIDSGGSDALWLFEDATSGLPAPKVSFRDFLGHGLSGSIYGMRSKISEFSLGKFKLKSVNVAYPDATSIDNAKYIKDRNGSLAGGLLKRFNIIFDAQGKQITLKRNKYFNSPFYYNKSGLAVEHNGMRVIKKEERTSANAYNQKIAESSNSTTANNETRYEFVFAPSFTIVEMRKNSPADLVGLKIGDVITKVNGSSTENMSLQRLTGLFYDKDGKRIKLSVERNGIELRFSFLLKSILN